MMQLRFTMLAIFLTAVHVLTPDAAYAIENGTWTHHTRQAPTTDIWTMHTLADGSMWASTGKALHEFDGVRWQKHAFATDRFMESAPFFADSTGVFYYYLRAPDTIVTVDFTGASEQITDYSVGFSLNPVSGAVQGPDGVYLYSKNNSNGGIYRFHDGTLELIRAGKTNSLTFDLDGRLWAVHQEPGASEFRFLMREDDIWNDVSGNIPSVTYSTVVATAPDGAVWINNEGRHSVYRDGVWNYYDGGTNRPLYIAFGPDGSVWGLRLNSIYQRSESGIWELSCWFEDDETYASPYFFTSLPGYPRCISNGHSVYRYDESVLSPTHTYPWSPLPNPFDLGSDTITTMAFTLDGLLVCGHCDPYSDTDIREGAGLSYYDGQSWHNTTGTIYDSMHYLCENVFAVKKISDGGVMISSDSGYSTYFDGLEWSYIDSLQYEDQYENIRTATDFGEDASENLWVATFYGLIEHDYIDDSTMHYPPYDAEIARQFSNMFIHNGSVYLRETYTDKVVSYDTHEDKWTNHEDLSRSNVRDYIVYNRHASEPWIMAAIFDGLYWSREDLNREQVVSEDSGEIIELPYASLVDLDFEGNIWASGYNNTGYIDPDGNWNRIEALQNMQANVFTYDYIDQYAVNSITIDTFNGEEIVSYDGLYLYTTEDTGVAENRPEAIQLSANYPNPFNASTTISFDLPMTGRTLIGIYSTTGQLVRTLVDDRLPSGRNTIVWDSRDNEGKTVASGLYLYRIIAGPAVMTGKMLLLK